MSLADTPSGERVHISFFGRRNVGKSSLVNCVTGQETAIVSDEKGTTTDPVYKSMELLPLGPVVIIDTPGYDDSGELGTLRVRRTRQVLNKTDIAVLVTDAHDGLLDSDRELLRLFDEKELPYIIVFNKTDLAMGHAPERDKEIYVSALHNDRIWELKEKLAAMKPAGDTRHLIGELIGPGDIAVLVVPIDAAAPKGRLILPQQLAIRDILDMGGTAIAVQESGLQGILEQLTTPPSIVVTDSQVFDTVSRIVPESVPLTSFSILMASYKGFLSEAVRGASCLTKLKDGDTVLIAEGCTHHRQCTDIGTVKLPRWLRKFTGRELLFNTVSGTEFPEDLSKYAVIIHCGGCMLNDRELQYRMRCAVDQRIPFTNYGISIAYMQGILGRCIAVFPDASRLLK